MGCNRGYLNTHCLKSTASVEGICINALQKTGEGFVAAIGVWTLVVRYMVRRKNVNQ